MATNNSGFTVYHARPGDDNKKPVTKNLGMGDTRGVTAPERAPLHSAGEDARASLLE